MKDSNPTAQIGARFDLLDGKTRMSQLFCGAPLKIAKPFQSGESLSVMVMDSSPGLLAGDCYAFDWRLDAGARVQLSTQGFTRVHPSCERPCALQTCVNLERGAWLESFPEPLMLFEDAALRQETTVEMADGATLMMGEVWCAGRTGRKSGQGSEAWRFHSFENRLRVRLNGELLFINQTRLRPQEFDPRALGAWDGHTHAGNFYVFSPAVDASWPKVLREAVNREAIENGAPVDVGISLLHRHGVAASFLGRRACDLQSIISRLRTASRALLCASSRAS